MRIRIKSLCRISAYFVLVSLAISGGCARRKTQGLFTKAELVTIERLAVLGLTPEQEQIFMASYLKAFPGKVITFVERALLQEVISEQDLRLGRLDEKTRARVKQVLGVEALIICTYYDVTGGVGTKKLRVRIVNSTTGAIVGSVITQGRDNFEYHCNAAVKALEADLFSSDHYKYLNR
ncbi:MAG: hypothetical protein ACYS32_17310 [Planctomycetota bacterium]|jgi:hypothetical protein